MGSIHVWLQQQLLAVVGKQYERGMFVGMDDLGMHDSDHGLSTLCFSLGPADDVSAPHQLPTAL